jgi:hypothetical protein
MPAAERTQSFVVVGAYPTALAVAAGQVNQIVPEGAFDGPSLDLVSLTAGEGDQPGHVLVVLGPSREIGLLVRGRPRLMAVSDAEVLELPALIARRSRMSHVLAPGGRPLFPVLHLARIDEALDLLDRPAPGALEPEI